MRANTPCKFVERNTRVPLKMPRGLAWGERTSHVSRRDYTSLLDNVSRDSACSEIDRQPRGMSDAKVDRRLWRGAKFREDRQVRRVIDFRDGNGFSREKSFVDPSRVIKCSKDAPCFLTRGIFWDYACFCCNKLVHYISYSAAWADLINIKNDELRRYYVLHCWGNTWVVKWWTLEIVLQSYISDVFILENSALDRIAVKGLLMLMHHFAFNRNFIFPCCITIE